MTITPRFEFNKYDFGFGMLFIRENESKKYIRKRKTVNYIFGVTFLWFSFWFEILLEGNNE